MSSIKHNSIQADAEYAELNHEFGVEHRLYLKCKHDLALATEALEKLAKLGNEPHYGNSIGNQIAIDALRKVGAGGTAAEIDEYEAGYQHGLSDGRTERPNV